ncbi:uncharacterized protein LOC113018369 [Astatotilapia calliptera]|uniref:uncharacterized protein LOC113018369 n=1 Tax=Astatotilapia calliptera TaxID=8154 RepID=UPI000E416D8C|nr:uncharacterized protein LOC113018369 [Astatotilapia calliptera]
MKDGDVSLILKDVMINYAGTYKCRVFMAETDSLQLISIISLRVDPPGGQNKNTTGESKPCTFNNSDNSNNSDNTGCTNNEVQEEQMSEDDTWKYHQIGDELLVKHYSAFITDEEKSRLTKWLEEKDQSDQWTLCDEIINELETKIQTKASNARRVGLQTRRVDIGGGVDEGSREVQGESTRSSDHPHTRSQVLTPTLATRESHGGKIQGALQTGRRGQVQRTKETHLT